MLVALAHVQVAHSLLSADFLVRLAPILEFFFVISGFVVAMVFGDGIKDGRSFGAFLINRMGRAWPVHLVTLGLLVVLEIVKAVVGSAHGAFAGFHSGESLIAQIFLVQTWAPGMGLTWNFPAWALSAEFAAYLAMSLMVLAFPARGLRRIAAALIAVASAIIFHRELIGSPEYNVISVARCLTGFFVGFLLFDLWRVAALRTEATATIVQAAALIAFVLALAGRFDGWAYFIYFPVCALLVFAFATDRGWFARALSQGPLNWIGKMSFSLYMIHGVIVIFMQAGFAALGRALGQDYFITYTHAYGPPVELISLGAAWANDVLTVSYFIMVVGATMLLFRYVENPTRAVSSRLAKQWAAGGGARGAALEPRTQGR